MDIYQKIASEFELNEGDRIWISSELIKLILKFKKQNIKFDGNNLINSFQDIVGPEGTIIIPDFSFEFSNNKFYDITKTKGITGILGNIAMQRSDFSRTQHPMHSFEVWGKDKEKLVLMNNKNSFGPDSPFGYCISDHVKQVIIGTDYVHAMTFIHYAEVTCNVPYRFTKSFIGEYVTKTGKIETRAYDYAARKLELQPEEKFNRMGKVLETAGISKKMDINGIECYLVDLARSYPMICQDIIENKCFNIYDFNVSRDEIFR